MTPAAHDLKSWTVGRVKITRVVEVEHIDDPIRILPDADPKEVQKISWLFPDYATPEGELKLRVQSWLVETPTLKILVDTGIGNGKTRLPFDWDNLKTPYLEKLAAAGCPAESIDMVICTHIHVDHVGWNTKLVDGAWVPTFPNARYKFGKVEYDYCNSAEDDSLTKRVFEQSVRPIVDCGLADLIESDAQLCEEILLISSPGHTIGHTCVLIRSDGAEAVLIADVAHNPCQMQRIEWSGKFDHDKDASAETRKQIFARFADTATLVFGGHFDPGHIVRDGDAFKLIA